MVNPNPSIDIIPYVHTKDAERPRSGAATIIKDLNVTARSKTTIKIAKKNKYIRELYKETYFTLIEITKRIYKICTGIKLNKTNIKSRSMPRSTKKSEKTQRSSTRLSKK